MVSPQDFLEMIKSRQSDRRYESTPVEKEKLDRCLEAARLAPSACNSQPWTFIVVDRPELKNAVADTTANKMLPLNHFTKQAPVHVAIVMESPNITSKFGEVIRDKKYTLMDVGIAASQFCLQAEAENLGTCMIGWFNEKKVKELLSVPAGKRVMLIITLGYPAGKKRKKIRKEFGRVVRHNYYNNEYKDRQDTEKG